METMLIGFVVVLALALASAISVAVRFRRERDRYALELGCAKAAEVVRDFAAIFGRLPKDQSELRRFCGDSWTFRSKLEILAACNAHGTPVTVGPEDHDVRFVFIPTGNNRYVGGNLPDFIVKAVDRQALVLMRAECRVEFFGPVDLQGAWWYLFTERSARA